MARINSHNAWLGVELLFKRLPAMEAWLKEQYNDDYVAEVSFHQLHPVPMNGLHSFLTDGEQCHKATWDPYQQHQG